MIDAQDTFLRLKEVTRRTTYSRTRIYELIKLGRFPAPISLGGGRAIAWTASSISNWMQECITASNNGSAKVGA